MPSIRECTVARNDFADGQAEALRGRFNEAIKNTETPSAKRALIDLRDDVLLALLFAAKLRQETLVDTGHLGDRGVLFDEQLARLNKGAAPALKIDDVGDAPDYRDGQIG